MQRQFVINVDTSNSAAVTALETTNAPVSAEGGQFVAQTDDIHGALNSVESRIVSGLIAAVRS